MRFLRQSRKNWCAILVCLIAALIAAGAFFAWFWNVPQKTEINLKFEAKKLGGLDKELGSAQICIKGNYYDYLWREDIYELSLAPFDHYENIRLKENGVTYFAKHHRGCVAFTAYNTEMQSDETLYLHFTGALDRFVIQRRVNGYYAGSVGGKYTSQECISYYKGLLGNEDYAVDVPVDLTVRAVKMNLQGEELGAIQLHMKGYYQERLFAEDYLSLEFDDFEQYIAIETAYTTVVRFEETENGKNIGSLVLGAGKFPGYEPGGFILTFTEELDRFYLLSDENEIYVASVSGKYTAREIVEYFNAFTKTGITLPAA